MASASVKALRSQLRNLASEIKPLKKRRINRARASKQKPFGLTPHDEKLVVSVYVISNWDTALAAQRLIDLQGHRGADVPSLAHAKQLVEDIFLIIKPDDFAEQLHDPVDPATQRLVTEARRYIAEARTVDWVAEQNTMHGVAPGSAMVRDHFDELLHATMSGHCAAGQRGGKQWARRWSRRWGVKRGRLAKQAPISAEMTAAKESRFGLEFLDTTSHFATKKVKSEVQFSGPFSGRPFCSQ